MNTPSIWISLQSAKKVLEDYIGVKFPATRDEADKLRKRIDCQACCFWEEVGQDDELLRAIAEFLEQLYTCPVVQIMRGKRMVGQWHPFCETTPCSIKHGKLWIDGQSAPYPGEIRFAQPPPENLEAVFRCGRIAARGVTNWQMCVGAELEIEGEGNHRIKSWTLNERDHVVEFEIEPYFEGLRLSC